MLCDSHAHLDDEAFIADLPEVVNHARSLGINRILCPGTNISSSEKILEIARRFPHTILPAVGIHPHEAKTWNENTAEQLECLIKTGIPVAVGETGLDYHYDFSPKDKQQEVFREHIRLAYKYYLPLICHLRKAEEDFINIIKEEPLPNPPGVIHCYSSGIEFLEEFLKRGFYIGFTGMITFKKAEEIKSSLKNVPISRLLIETDAPYMAPEPYRGKRCEPAYSAIIAQHASSIKELPYEKLCSITTANLMTMLSRELP